MKAGVNAVGVPLDTNTALGELPSASMDMLSVLGDAGAALQPDVSKLTLEDVQGLVDATAEQHGSLEEMGSDNAHADLQVASAAANLALKEWLNKNHPGWQAKCGLVPAFCKANGQFGWVMESYKEEFENSTPAM